MSSGTKRPIVELEPFAQRLLERLRPYCARIEIAGSIRRRVPYCGDIELVAIPKVGMVATATAVTDLFGKQPTTPCVGNLLWATLDLIVPMVGGYVKRGEKYRQFTLDGIVVDLFTARADNWGWQFLIRTGSAEFSHRMAISLNDQGYTSKEGVIVNQNTGETVVTQEENDVFALAKRQLVEPVKRSI